MSTRTRLQTVVITILVERELSEKVRRSSLGKIYNFYSLLTGSLSSWNNVLLGFILSRKKNIKSFVLHTWGCDVKDFQRPPTEMREKLDALIPGKKGHGSK